MIKIIDNDITRGGEKIGWITSNDVFGHDGRKIGYFMDNDIYDVGGHKLAYIEGNHLYPHGSTGTKISLTTVNESIVGGVFNELAKCAIYVLLGS